MTAHSDYTGPTQVNGGKLVLAAGSQLDETAIAVAGGATLAPQPGSGLIITNTAGGLATGATLSLQSGLTFDMTDGSVGAFTLKEPSNPGTVLTLGGATLKFDLNSSGADSLNVTSGSAALSGLNTISITGLGSSLTTGSYPLITAAGGLGVPGDFSLSASTISVGGTTYNLALQNSSTAESLAVTPGLSSTLFTLAAGIQPRMIVSSTAAFSGSITNSGTAGSDLLNYNLAASVASGGTLAR